ncbi:HAD family hydrolase [Propionivibrio dicarboxylicus]|uniref:phosphoglycolate phosphatase n=1 Tax=Propionivibrio dicarboxylicus TaxID=83767 RepID=A0A1G8D867_9RHOO|nr:HAD-IIIA family hydrolase [Propionivibrio dicarboxylicus]SDH53460.1 phosphoglycolate phosphatase [Propionivibrio dicarboxylicus]
MGKRFELLVFDWDGTLHDSVAAIVTSLQRACLDLDQCMPTDLCARQVIGLGLVDALRHVAPELDEARYPELADRYRFHYLASDLDLKLFDGIHDMIEELHARGYLLAVATGKSRRGLNRVLEYSGIGSFFSASRCADECFSKPHPQMLLELMDEFAIDPENVLMIGDTTHDMQMAINAGVNGMAVTYGAHSSTQLAALNPLWQVDSVADLSALLMDRA